MSLEEAVELVVFALNVMGDIMVQNPGQYDRRFAQAF